MDPLTQAIKDCENMTPNWKPDGTGFRTGVVEPSWDTTDTEDREIIWTNVGKITRLVYLVVDEGNTYKPYIDRYFIFGDAGEAIAKLHTLLIKADDDEPVKLKTLYGNLDIKDLTPDVLKPGIRYVFRRDGLEAIILAVPRTGKVQW